MASCSWFIPDFEKGFLEYVGTVFWQKTYLFLKITIKTFPQIQWRHNKEIHVQIYEQKARLTLFWIRWMITTKRIKWLIWSFISNLEHKQFTNSAYQSSVPILKFECVFAYLLKKADPCLCFIHSWIWPLMKSVFTTLSNIYDGTFFKNS